MAILKSPHEAMGELDVAGDAYTIAVILADGTGYGSLEVYAHNDRWLKVQRSTDGAPDGKAFWLNMAHVALIEIQEL